VISFDNARIGEADLYRGLSTRKNEATKGAAACGAKRPFRIQSFQDLYALWPNRASHYAGHNVDHSSRAICAGALASSSNPETDTPSSLTAFCMGNSAFNNSAETASKSLRLPDNTCARRSGCFRSFDKLKPLRLGFCCLGRRPERLQNLKRSWTQLRSSAPARVRQRLDPSKTPSVQSRVWP
jgi:hypothetical protein